MQIIPAIDIRNGKCVRLVQGDFAMEKIYDNDPIKVAKKWEKEGALTLHVVDLDGAKNGYMKNVALIKEIIKTVSIPVQVGGGIRNKKTVEQLLKSGVSNVIVGTLALEDKKELKNILLSFPTRVIIALDAKNGKLMKQGWVAESNDDTLSTALKLESYGVKRFIFTDVIKDGTLSAPNYKEIKNVVKSISVPIIVGGGISTIDQVKKLKSLGVKGVIIGKALYEKRIILKEVLNVS